MGWFKFVIKFHCIMGLTNNDIFKKLRVAHQLTNTDIVKIFALNDFKITESELGAIFRREDHPKYVECGDQYLRNFLDGLIIYLRGPLPPKKKGGKKHFNESNKKRSVALKTDRKKVGRTRINRPNQKGDKRD